MTLCGEQAPDSGMVRAKAKAGQAELGGWLTRDSGGDRAEGEGEVAVRGGGVGGQLDQPACYCTCFPSDSSCDTPK